MKEDGKAMLAVNYSALRSNMKDYMDQVTEDCETLLITRTADRDNVVALSENSYETMRENLYLLQSFGSQQWLSDSLQQLAQGLSRVQAVPGADRPVIFSENAWQDYCAWQADDPKLCRRIDTMLAELAAGTTVTGRPRALQGDLQGCWSRRITDRDRLIYRTVPEGVQVLACRFH